MRHFSSRRSSRFVIGGGTLLLALSLYGTSLPSATQVGQVAPEQRGTFLNVRELGTTVTRARQEWRTLRFNIRNATPAAQPEAALSDATEVTLRSAELSAEHLEITYALPDAACVSLWMTGEANQRFDRLSVIGGIPCSMATGDLSARLLLTSVQPALAEGQLIKLCTNTTHECSEPIAITAASPAHSAAGTSVTIHSASIVRNSTLSVTYSKSAGCVNLVRWNGAGDSRTVTFNTGSFSCDAVENARASIAVMGMQPVLGPTQWIHLCAQDQPGSCSNVYQIR